MAAALAVGFAWASTNLPISSLALRFFSFSFSFCFSSLSFFRGLSAPLVLLSTGGASVLKFTSKAIVLRRDHVSSVAGATPSSHTNSSSSSAAVAASLPSVVPREFCFSTSLDPFAAFPAAAPAEVVVDVTPLASSFPSMFFSFSSELEKASPLFVCEVKSLRRAALVCSSSVPAKSPSAALTSLARNSVLIQRVRRSDSAFPFLSSDTA